MFRRKRADQPSSRPPGPMAELRRQVLELDPTEVAVQPTPDLPHVWGALMETGYPEGTATLVAIADGTTSLYTSASFGIIGGGEHASVAAAAGTFLRVVEAHLDRLPPSPVTNLPAEGHVVLRALTYSGRHAIELAEDLLGEGEHALSAVFYAGHDVITQLRLISEAPP